MPIRFPLWSWSTSTLSERKIAVTTTWFPADGLAVTGPYWFRTEMLALGPTVKRYSFFVSAIAAIATQTRKRKMRPALTARCMLPINKLSSICLRQTSRSSQCLTLWQRTIQSHLVKHRLLLVGLQKVLPGFAIIRILVHRILCVADVGIHIFEIVFIHRLHQRRAFLHLRQHLLIVLAVRSSGRLRRRGDGHPRRLG